MVKFFNVIAVIAFLFFVTIWASLNMEWVQKVDQWGTNTFAGNQFLEPFHYIGETIFVVIVAIILVIFLYMKKRYRQVYFVLFALIGGTIINQGIKFIVQRPRPTIPEQLTSYSFPSGHSMLSMIYLMTLAYVLTTGRNAVHKKWAFCVALVLTILVGLSRVAGSRHFMTDVLGGWSLGFACFMAVVFWYQRRK
ncbi:phosphatase PAP2 family protein [Kurthia senegalensis]|uniref:phosphatase PAP2 family protein n=1 Tax=Kurthia senegalensis TaxID=1033740 RepID=UPI000288858A|nr:phosphatase PAP2 family protein [Kurthia senegalensis]